MNLAERLKEEIPITSVLQDYNIPVRQVSPTRGVCRIRPEDKTPSCSVYLQKNTWYDYGMAKGGSVIDLCMFLEQCSPAQAMKILSQRYHIAGWKEPEVTQTKSNSNNHKRYAKEPESTKRTYSRPVEEKWLSSAQYQSIGIYTEANRMNQLFQDDRTLYTSILKEQALPTMLEHYHGYLRNLYLDQQEIKRNPQNREMMQTLMQEAYDSYLACYKNLLYAAKGTNGLDFKKMRPDLGRDQEAVASGKKAFWNGGVSWQELKRQPGEQERLTLPAATYQVLEREVSQENVRMPFDYCAFQQGDTVTLTVKAQNLPALRQIVQGVQAAQRVEENRITLSAPRRDAELLQGELQSGRIKLPFPCHITIAPGWQTAVLSLDKANQPEMERILEGIHAMQMHSDMVSDMKHLEMPDTGTDDVEL